MSAFYVISDDQPYARLLIRHAHDLVVMESKAVVGSRSSNIHILAFFTNDPVNISRQPNFSSIFHLRDFIDTIADDPSRDGPNFVELQTDINIFEEDGFYSPNIIVEPIRTRIHAYLTREQRDAYVPNAFFYADGRFSAAASEDGTLEISIQTLSLMRHPGDVADFDEYRHRLPEQWCPMVSIIGSVPSSESNSTSPSEHRQFVVETSVYDPSKTAPVHFSVVCFLENTKRWQKVKTPPSGAFLSVTAKLAGRTTDTNRLALRVLDLTYLPRPSSATATPTPAATPTSKRSRWEGRAPSSTPSKKSRTSKPVNGITTPSNRNETPPEPTQAGINLPPTGDLMKSPFVTPSSSTTVDHEDSLVDSIPPSISDNGIRPHRSRHPPKKYTELD